MSSLTFDAATHVYRLGDRVLPGITSILRAAGMLDDLDGIPEEYRERGNRVHRAILFDVHGDLGDCDPADLPYVEAARKAVRELGFVVSHAEHLCCEPTLGFATQVDAVGTIERKHTICNWKTSASVIPAYAVQTAGEALAAFNSEARTVQRIGIHLTDDGKYKVRPYTDRDDFEVFLSALRIRQWKEKTQ